MNSNFSKTVQRNDNAIEAAELDKILLFRFKEPLKKAIGNNLPAGIEAASLANVKLGWETEQSSRELIRI